MIGPQPYGDEITEEAQDAEAVTLQSAATADGPGTAVNLTGMDGQGLLELSNTGTGTTTIAIEGSFDSVNWYAAGYQQIDGIAAPTRATAVFALAASPTRHVLQILDHYPYFRARLTGSIAPVAVTANLRQFPQ